MNLQASVCKNGFVIEKMAGKLSAERAYKRRQGTETQTTSNKPETRMETESKMTKTKSSHITQTPQHKERTEWVANKGSKSRFGQKQRK